VTLRDIPRGRYSALASAYSSAVGVLSKVLDLEASQAEALIQSKADLDDVIASATVEVMNVEALGSAWQLIYLARLALVRWGVQDHNPDSFKTVKVKGEPSSPTPFSSVSETWEGVTYQLASPRMIALYSHPKVGLLGNLSHAVRAFNEDRWETPEELWAKDKREAEEAARKAEGKAPPAPLEEAAA